MLDRNLLLFGPDLGDQLHIRSRTIHAVHEISLYIARKE